MMTENSREELINMIFNTGCINEIITKAEGNISLLTSEDYDNCIKTIIEVLKTRTPSVVGPDLCPFDDYQKIEDKLEEMGWYNANDPEEIKLKKWCEELKSQWNTRQTPTIVWPEKKTWNDERAMTINKSGDNYKMGWNDYKAELDRLNPGL